MDKLLKGKTVLVTGAAKRIGRAIALALAERGASTAITYLASQPEAEKTVRALAAHEYRRHRLHQRIGPAHPLVGG